MKGKIFMMEDQSKLVPMEESKWEAEDMLQRLIAEYHDLLGGDQINVDEHRRWLLITREMPMVGDESEAIRLSLDHLFLDQDGIPTLVEVKRGDNNEIRRQVVGQLLDYAAIANTCLGVPDIKLRLENRLRAERSNKTSELVVREFLGENSDVDEFWRNVQSNLDRGELRLIILANSIPSELRRVVEFLNRQMNPAEFLAVEVKQFESGENKVLVPRVLGVTEVVRQRKHTASGVGRQWDEPMLMDAIEEAAGVEIRSIAKDLLEWITPQVNRVFWGSGLKTSSFIPVTAKGRTDYQIFKVNSDAVFVFPLDWLVKKPPFDQASVSQDLIDKINAIPGIPKLRDAYSGRVRFSMALLKDPQALSALKTAISFILDQIKTIPSQN
jgi:hypothetical protein